MSGLWKTVALVMVLPVTAEETPEVNGLNLGIAVMLLGSIAFMMATFYMVNHSDKDLRIMTWKVICATISIFVSVLIYQAFDDAIKAMFLEGASHMVTMQVAFLHSFVWFVLLQLLLATVSRAISWPCQSAVEDTPDDQRELDLKCWAVILGHITGFASISAWSQLQAHLGGSVLILPMAFFSLWALFRVTDMVREWVSLADDGVKDKMEEAWDEATEETEDDVMALTLSFLVVQTFRFWIYGVLPDEEGNLDNRQIDPSLVQAFVSLGVGMLIALLSYLRTIYGSSKHSRYSVWLRLISDFSSCWMVMFSIDRIMTITSLGGAEYGVLGNVITACFLTFFSFTVMYFLDKEADKVDDALEGLAEEVGQTADAKKMKSRKKVAMRATVLAIGVLIGFAWERCFDVAVDETAEREASEGILPPSLVKVVLALMLATLVVPAWRWYILPVVRELGGFEEGEEEDEETGGAKEGYMPPILPEDLYRELEALKQKAAKLQEEKEALERQVESLQRLPAPVPALAAAAKKSVTSPKNAGAAGSSTPKSRQAPNAGSPSSRGKTNGPR